MSFEPFGARGGRRGVIGEDRRPFSLVELQRLDARRHYAGAAATQMASTVPSSESVIEITSEVAEGVAQQVTGEAQSDVA